MDGLTEGRIVHFVMPNGQHRPAIVVNNWNIQGNCEGGGYVNLTVFSDWTNDTHNLPDNFYDVADIKRGMFWATSVCPDEETKKPGTWHWIERA